MRLRKARPRTDRGTIALHWSLATAMVVAIATGLRIAAEGPTANKLEKMLAPYLPTSQLWLIHMLSGIALFGLLLGYVTLIRMAGLGQRIALNTDRLAGLITGGRARWSAINILLYWVFFVVTGWQVVSGTLIHLGYGSRIVSLHSIASWVIIGFIAGHILSHAAMGGIPQLMRVIRPGPGRLATVATTGPGTMRLPAQARAFVAHHKLALLVLTATSVGLAGYSLIEQGSVQRLKILRVQAGPGLDADLDNPVWAQAKPLQVLTYDGINLDHGTSAVEIQAVHDDRRAYFAFTWQDPTRSTLVPPMIKTTDGWSLGAVDGAGGQDQFAMMLSTSSGTFGPGAFHPGRKPLEGRPPSGSGHGLHYTTDNSSVDVLLWHAGPDSGWCDLERFGAPADPTEAQRAGREPYRGGVSVVATYGHMRSNSAWALRPGKPVLPLRLPTLAAQSEPKQIAAFTPSAPLLAATDRGPDTDWSLRIGAQSGTRQPPPLEPSAPLLAEADSVPFGPEIDAQRPVGTTAPALLAVPEEVASEQRVSCRARWAAGRWTLVVSRPLAPLRPEGIAVADGVSLWVAPFDRTASDHSRHLRSIQLEVRR